MSGLGPGGQGPPVAARPGPGPRVVALGGGHGLATTLRAVRRFAGQVTAIVSVADDGGSSGRLRAIAGLPPPGDIRRCLVALGDETSTWGRALEHRFEAGELDGHPLGNLLIAGLAGATGDFQAAVDEAGRLVGAVGRVLPATVEPVVLTAELAGGGRVEGQVKVANAGPIATVSVLPADAAAPAAAVEAITGADMVVLGPGSLYTSVLAVAVVPAIGRALASTGAQLVYVCNLRPQVPETEGYGADAHLAALAAHGLRIDTMLHDPSTMAACPARSPAAGGGEPPRCVERELARPGGAAHDPARLAAALSDLFG